MKTFLLAGSIVDTDADKETFEDVTPVQINAALNKLEPNEELELEITSYGGSVIAGLAICNLLKKASAEGHKTTAHVVGIAASMASAIACACDNLKIDSNAFLMVHQPWTMTIGNAIDLRKEAEVLDQYRDALLAIYRTKFECSEEVIKKMLEDETWIIGASAPMFTLKCEVIPTQEQQLRVAAFAKKMPKFMHTPKALKDIIMEKEQTLKAQDDLTTSANNEMNEKEDIKEEEKTATEEVVQETVEAEAVETEEKTEAVVEEKKEEAQVEDLVAKTNAALEAVEDLVPKAEVDKRVSGMQSVMAKQMDAMKKDYEAKIADFQVQIKARDEELTKAKAEVTSLSESLKKSAKELAEMTSAFKEKADALDALNASVNTPNEQTNWKALKGKEFFDWYKKTH